MFKIGALAAGCSAVHRLRGGWLGLAGRGAAAPSSSDAGSGRPTPAPFTLVAHRGGALVYPESSAEAFEAVGETAFPIETDLRQLQDGTLVPLHDDAAERTMTGVTGRPGDITPSQWAAARIRHPSARATCAD